MDGLGYLQVDKMSWFREKRVSCRNSAPSMFPIFIPCYCPNCIGQTIKMQVEKSLAEAKLKKCPKCKGEDKVTK